MARNQPTGSNARRARAATRESKTRHDKGDVPALAKFTRPATVGTYPRSRLFRLLDQARRKHPVVWLSAPGGAGKTTLIASYAEARNLPALWYQVDAADNDPAAFFYYLGEAAKAAAPRWKRSLPLLTPEYLAGLSVFATNYFRELFSRLKRPGLVVFDNYQELSNEGVLQEILQRAVAEIPPQLNMVIVSREGPPPAFSRHRVSGAIALLGWDELKLTSAESTHIVKRRLRHVSLSREALERLHERTHGWVAGLVLLTERAEQGMSPLTRAQNFPGEAVFDYFAAEIFSQAEPNVKTFLLKTVFLPRISLPVVQALTTEPQAEAILSYLARRNLFTVRHTDGSYEYHPLFRSFLATRAPAHFGPTEFEAIKRKSAQLLAETGDIENAVSLLLQTPPDWSGALTLILAHARTLVATGRTQTLEQWLKALPENTRAQHPWALYWLGMCRLAFAPADARIYFEQAFALFEAQDDASPLHLAWSGIVESFALERNDFTPMRPWLARYSALTGNRKPPSRDIETASLFTYVLGLISTAFDHPDLPVYATRAAELLSRQSQGGQWFKGLVTLIPYYGWRGDLAEMRHIIDRLESHVRSPGARPLAQLSWYTWKCLVEGAIGNTDMSLQAVKDGLALADRTGIHVFDAQFFGYGIWGQLCADRVGTAREFLRRLAPLIGGRRLATAYHTHYASLVTLHEGDIPRAVELGRRSVNEARESGLSLGEMAYSSGLAFAIAAQGSLDEATQALAAARGLAVAMDSRLYVAYADLCEAYIHRARGEHEKTLVALKRAFARMRETGVTMPAYCPRADAAALCAFALERGVETDYVRSMIAQGQLAPPSGSYPEEWPWPIRIYTLGRFAVVKDGAPLAFGAKARKRPLELLRTLIILGGRDVSVSKLSQILWPEADGDLARRSIETTLHRLRRLIGDQCIVREENQLSLNPRYCWLDVRAFERWAEVSEGTEPSTEKARRLLKLYRGPFLSEDDGTASLLLRERLQTKFVRGMERLGDMLEGEGSHDLAASCYEEAIDIEPAAENLYRRLMRCYQTLQRPTEALAVYRRCLIALTSILQVEPTDETRALYEEIGRTSR